MTINNVSWNLSTRGEYYSLEYEKELAEIKSYVASHLLGGLKFISWQEIEFLLKLKWHEDSVRFLLRAGCHPSLNFYLGGGYVIVDCITGGVDRPVCERFFNIGFEASPPECFKTFKKFFNVDQIVRYLEVNGQVSLGYAIEASPYTEDLGYVEDLKEDDYWRTYTPITWEAIERLPLLQRKRQLADTYLSNNVRSISHHFSKTEEEVKILLGL